MREPLSPSADAALSPAPSAPRWRVVRATVIVVLAVSISILALIVLAAGAPVVRESLKPLFSEHAIVSIAAAVVILLAALLVPLAALSWLARNGHLTALRLAVLACVVGTAFTYLMWDDPVVRRPLTMDELAPPLPGDEISHGLILRYGKGTPATNAYRAPTEPIVARVGPKAGEKWTEHLQKNRAAIEAGWEDLRDVRAWWDELARQPRLGDLTPPRFDAMIMAFQPVRAYSQHASAIAGLKALDGHADEAADMMIELYDVARKFEPASRTLVRSMIGKVIQRIAIETIGFILDHGPVSPAKRAALAQVLATGTGGPAGARRLVLIEYAYFQPYLDHYVRTQQEPGIFEQPWVRWIVARFSRILINPRATQNLMGDRYYQLATLAEQRRLGEFEVTSKAIERTMGTYQVKNLGGRLVADMAMPAFSKIVKSYWDVDDARVALLARLQS
jgi:hypothetical protein